MYWDTLRKSYVIIHVAYDHTTATLFAENISVRAGDPFDLSIDLNKNLRTRYKSVGTCIDARDLANGEIGTLQSVQIDDDKIYDGIERHLGSLDEVPKVWRLHVALEGAHWFTVRPEVRGRRSLWFHVLSPAVVSPVETPEPRK